MITENLSTLKIHKLTKEQYEREFNAGRTDNSALYLVPDEEIDLSLYATVEDLNAKADVNHKHSILDITNLQSSLDGKVSVSRTINGKALTSNITLSASDIGALPANTVIPSIEGLATEIYVDNTISNHNISTSTHNDIRLLIDGLTTRLNTLADSDDTTLDQMSELVAYIKSNKTLIEEVTTNKVNVSDIIDDLTTNVTNKPLSAAQGVVLKALIDAITVPTKVSELTNDKGYLTSYTETDPTVPAWAKASSKPAYTKSEVGLGNVDNVKQYSASNPPPYPVISVNGQTGAVTVNVPTSLKNPNSITFTGAVTGSYDGSSAVTIDVPTVAGDPGYTPVRGKDYWTDADKAEIKAYVDEAILGGAW